jgi:threonylcarbamoyladenosine tRNA methylthiotransferase MtaB
MRIFLDTIGCRLNQSEIEHYARQFRVAGHSLVESPEFADLVVINTCAVTAAAVSDSRQKIRQAARQSAGQIIATGCWSSLNPESVVKIPGVTHVVDNKEKNNLVSNLLHIPTRVFDLEFVERQPIPGARKRTRAFIKAQDGCDNRCTFCVTTIARGPGKSRVIPEVLSDVRSAVAGGSKEIVLTGVHLGSWGSDLSPDLHLRHLVQAILNETDVPRIRLSSLEPWDLDASFFELWQDERLCRHLHLPLQSGSSAILRRMARKITPDSYAKLISTARASIPDLSITTDVIVGFPGESTDDFEESLLFIESMNFAGGHVFSYSARPGTAASDMKDQILDLERKQRNAIVRSVLEQSAYAYKASFLQKELPVLWEKAEKITPGEWELSGLTGNYLRVSARSKKFLWNKITPTRFMETTSRGLYGIISLQKN